MVALQYSLSNMGKLESSQQGAVLIVSLVILLVLTILGMSAMRGSALEGKIASNYRLEQLITQAAEGALLEAERLIEGIDISTLVSDTCTNGYCTSRKSDDNYAASIGKSCTEAAHLEERWEVDNSDGCSGYLDVWNTADRSITYSSSNIELTAKIKASYIIEYLGFVGAAADCTPAPVTPCPDMYRVTALASDLSDKGRILIQTTYQK